MAVAARILASALVGSIVIGTATSSNAQSPSRSPVLPTARLASFSPGQLTGYVQDERGEPIADVVVSALGATTTVVVTDKDGYFQFGTLTPGPYLLRAHLQGYIAPRARTVHVHPSATSASSIALRRAGSLTMLAAGVGGVVVAEEDSQPEAEPIEPQTEAETSVESETAWRIRHARRGVLKQSTVADWLVDDDRVGPDRWAGVDVLGRAVGAPARAATSFFVETPFSGQVNLLTSGSFDTPQQLLSSENLSNNIAYVRLGAPVGEQADWAVRAALSQSNISSWIVAGSYSTRAAAQRRHDIGFSYATQRYDTSSPALMRDAADNGRNAGAVYAYDTFVLSPSFAFTYGASYSRYDYLEQRNLLSPRVEMTITPAEGLRVSAAAARRQLAPGAEEFVPPADSGVWLPPQRTFSSVDRRLGFQAEDSAHVEAALERDFGSTTIGVRAFQQRVENQMVTLFGTSMPGLPSAQPGHYLVGNVGGAEAQGCRVSVRTLLMGRVHGSVEYTMANAQLTPAADSRVLMFLSPSATRLGRERLHDVSTTLETEVPETATRLYVLYRVGNGYAQPTRRAVAGRVDGRFDIQIRQSLPFMNFSTARWEMLIAVRNTFREAATEQSVYDELLVVRPPKRVIGGVTLKF